MSLRYLTEVELGHLRRINEASGQRILNQSEIEFLADIDYRVFERFRCRTFVLLHKFNFVTDNLWLHLKRMFWDD